MRISVLMVMLSWSMTLVSAHAWWNEQWTLRKKISIDTASQAGGIKQNLADFPVLIRLHSGNFDFTKVKENGEDLRFVDADDKTLLKHHIEMLDAFDEIALVWVKVPAVSAGTVPGAIWLYYGNGEAAAADDPADTFDTFYQGVYHFNGLEGLPKDSTSYGIEPAEYTGGLGLAGVIGNGATFSGAGSVLRLGDNPAFNFSTGLTVSCWIKINEPQEDAVLFSRGGEGSEMTLGLGPDGLSAGITAEGSAYKTEPTMVVSVGEWHHVALVLSATGQMDLYVDGESGPSLKTGIAPSHFSGPLSFGSDIQGNRSFMGDMDELRITGAPRNADWIKAGFISQGPAGNFAVVALEEVNEAASGMPVFYLATIFQNITLDGLVVIGILIAMGAASWVVMIMKGFFLWNTSKGNKAFMEKYDAIEAPMALEGQSDLFVGSGLYKIYKAGCTSLKELGGMTKRTQDALNGDDENAVPPPKPSLSAKAVESVKAVLERGLNDEMNRLNAWMIVLILCISGGPFLGLLGTVWGVMNTFAAMAEAGEANIMAIAPGVASALATTVFGLLVAIPALFGYNFLTGRIRSITAQSGMFVDQFGLKVDAAYGEEK
nr:DUF2341 domain-containing protein [uncultured Desulfobacter sp.]